MSRLTDHSTTLGETARAVICDIADQFQHSWNQGDGAGYAEPFAVDADYITIHGLHLTGRDTITAGISELYATLYRDSTIALEVRSRCRRRASRVGPTRPGPTWRRRRLGTSAPPDRSSRLPDTFS